MRLPFLLILLAACGGDEPHPTSAPIEGGWAEGVAGLWTERRTGEGGSPSGIEAIGYAGGWEEGELQGGVWTEPDPRSAPGWNLYSSGHGAVAVLVDERGQEQHRWEKPYAELPDAPPLDGEHQKCWRRVRMNAEGDLFAIHGGRALVRLDRDSKVHWVFGERVHHDLVLEEAGTILTLTRVERLEPRLDPRKPIVDDEVVRLSADGEVLARQSITAAFLASPYASHLPRQGGESLHTNSIQVLRGTTGVRGLEAGRLLLCARDLDLLFALDMELGRVTWAQKGDWVAPHDPRELESGDLALFDNLGGERGSRVLRLDPQSGAVKWSWPPADIDFFSRFCGSVRELEGGNWLITETGAGRAFEITAEGEVVWGFHTPHHLNDRWIAALFEVERVPEPTWLSR